MAGGDVGMATDGRGRVGKWGAGGLQRRKPTPAAVGGGGSVGPVRWAEGQGPGSLVGPLEEGPQLRLLQRAGVVHPPPLEALL